MTRGKAAPRRPLALVTGAGVRLGSAIALGLADAGCDLVLHAHRSRAAADRTARKAARAGRRAVVETADLADSEALEAFADVTVRRYGAPDFLVLSAANFLRRPLARTRVEDWDAVFDLNLRAQVLLASRFGEKMRRRGGAIVLIADAAGLTLWPGYAAHSLAKAGLFPAAKLLAADLAPKVRVNVVAPGPVLFPKDYSAADKRRAVAATLLKRAGSPDDVVKAVRFLCVEATYVTGAVLPVDGGRHLMGPG